MKLPAAIIIGVTLLITVAIAPADTNKGAEKIALDGGKKGAVSFPHHQHQNTLGDCKTCHELFPQEQGAINNLKAQGTLAPKQIMNKHCIKCHRALKKAGKPAGPTSCKKCHT